MQSKDRTAIAGLILAGGRSSRMGGGDKVLRPLGGRPLLAHAIERLAPQVGALALNANGDPDRFAAFGLTVVADTIAGHAGPLAGILAGMEWAIGRPGTTHIVSAAGDTPFFPGDLVARFLAANGGEMSRIVIAASSGRRHPVFALWPVALRQALADHMAAAGNLSVSGFAERHGCTVCDFTASRPGAASIDPFFNINTPADLAAAEAALAGAES